MPPLLVYSLPFLAGVTVGTGCGGARELPKLPPHGASAPPDVRLVPVPLTGAASNAWEQAYLRFRLTNASRDTLLRDGWGYGDVERQTLDGHWLSAPIGRCGTVTPAEPRIEAGGSVLVSALPPIGSEKVSAGHYRFVVRFTRASQPLTHYEVAAYFDVRGLDIASSESFLAAFSAPETLACVDSAERGRYAARFARLADPRRVLGLASAPTRGYEEALTIFSQLAPLPEACVPLLEVEQRQGAPHAAGVIVLEACRTEALAVAALWSKQAATRDLSLEQLGALARRPSVWPRSLPESLIRIVEESPYEDVALGASEALDQGDLANGLRELAVRAVRALRHRAADSSPAAKLTLERRATGIAIRARLEPPADEIGELFGEGGLGLSGLGEAGGGCGSSPAEDRCCQLRRELGNMLVTEPIVVHLGSRVDVRE